MKFSKIFLACSLLSYASLVFPADSVTQKEMDDEKAGIARTLLASAVVAGVGSSIASNRYLSGTGLDVGLQASSILGALSCLGDTKNGALRSMAISVPVLTVMARILKSDRVSGPNGIFAKFWMTKDLLANIHGNAQQIPGYIIALSNLRNQTQNLTAHLTTDQDKIAALTTHIQSFNNASGNLIATLQGIDSYKPAIFLCLAMVGTYIATKSYTDKFAAYASKQISNGYNAVTSHIAARLDNQN